MFIIVFHDYPFLDCRSLAQDDWESLNIHFPYVIAYPAFYEAQKSERFLSADADELFNQGHKKLSLWVKNCL